VSGSIVHRPQVNIAMAVSTPDGGLMTPVLKDAAEVDLYSLSRTWKDLVKRTMSKSLKADEYNSGTFFISNLGMFGVSAFDAILPPGAPSILAVAASKPVVALQSNGLVGVHKEMTVNITCDHRHIYGAQAAEFLRDLADLIENDVQSLAL
jgi:pyruvate dehydrogenase E2 component (dihydrolipoamide acetyltransferase)